MECCPRTSLPPEIFCDCLSFHTVEDVCKFSVISKSWKCACEDDYLWRGFLSLPNSSSFITFLVPRNADDEKCIKPKKMKQLFAELVALSTTTSLDLLDEDSAYKQSSWDQTSDDGQTIKNTLAPNSRFWSSAGSDSDQQNEFLIFKLRHPLCLLLNITITVYQASFQTGNPIYGPAKIKISVGYTPDHMHFSTVEIPTDNVNTPFVFEFSDNLVRGSYIRLDLYGRHQTQDADNKYYCCLREVRARGFPIGHNSTKTLNKFAIKHAKDNGCFDELKSDPDEFEADKKPAKIIWPTSLDEISSLLQIAAGSHLETRDKVFSKMRQIHKVLSNFTEGSADPSALAMRAAEEAVSVKDSPGLRSMILGWVQSSGDGMAAAYLISLMRALPPAYDFLHAEALVAGQLFVSDANKVVLRLALRTRKVECTEELGDLVADEDSSVATLIYARACAHNKVVEHLFRAHAVQELVRYAFGYRLQVDYADYLRRLMRLPRNHHAVLMAHELVTTVTNMGEVEILHDPREICEILQLDTSNFPENSTDEHYISAIEEAWQSTSGLFGLFRFLN